MRLFSSARSAVIMGDASDSLRDRTAFILSLLFRFRACRSATPTSTPPLQGPLWPRRAPARPSRRRSAPPRRVRAPMPLPQEPRPSRRRRRRGAGERAGAGPEEPSRRASRPRADRSRGLEGALAAVDRAYALSASCRNGDDSYLQAKEDIRVLAADLIRRIHAGGRRARRAAPVVDLACHRGNQHVQRELRSFTTVARPVPRGYRRSGLYRPIILERSRRPGSRPAQLAAPRRSWSRRALSRASASGCGSSSRHRHALRARARHLVTSGSTPRGHRRAIAYSSTSTTSSATGEGLAPTTARGARDAASRRSADEYLDSGPLRAAAGGTRRYVPRLLAALQIIENPRVRVTLARADARVGHRNRHGRALGEARAPRRRAGAGDGTSPPHPALRRQATPKRASSCACTAAGEALLAQSARYRSGRHPCRSTTTASAAARRSR